MGYYLAYGIYPEWATFVKTIHLPQCDKDKLFSERQEGARKDIERAFGVLEACFAILQSLACMWQVESLAEIMQHNMWRMKEVLSEFTTMMIMSMHMMRVTPHRY